MLEDDHFKLAACRIPAFKLNWEGIQEEKARLREMLVKQMSAVDVCDINTSRAPTSQNTEDQEEADFFGLNHSANISIVGAETPGEELERYLALPNDITLPECYGETRKPAFNRLKKLFLRTNTALPSSASVERLFRLVGAVYQPCRAKMNQTTLEKQCLLSANKDL